LRFLLRVGGGLPIRFRIIGNIQFLEHKPPAKFELNVLKMETEVLSDIKLDIVTLESIIYSDNVQAILAPGIEGDLGILPNHTPLITTLRSGVLMIRKDGEELHLAVFGGFLEVRPK
jgi:hypothetical protein